MRKIVRLKAKLKRAGYISLLTVMIISLVGVILTASMIALSTITTQTQIADTQGQIAKLNAESCAEHALQQLVANENYAGDETLMLDNGSCYIAAPGGTGTSDRTVITTGNIGDYAQQLSVEVAALTPSVQITSWTFLVVGEASVDAWYDEAWGQRLQITVNSNQVPGSGTHDNIPLYLDLSILPTSFFASVKSDGSDIVVTDSDKLTKLSRELVTLDINNEEGELWFKAPALSATSDHSFYIYFDNPAASETNLSDVWSNSYSMVHHLKENPGGVAPQANDSSPNNNDGTTVGSMDSSDLVTGKIGSGWEFNGSQSTDITSNSTITFGTAGKFSMQFWMKTTNSRSIMSIIDKRVGGEPYQGYHVYLSNGKVNVQLNDSASHSYGPYGGDLRNGQWHKVSVSVDYENNIMDVLVDGVIIANDVDISAVANDTTNAATFRYAGHATRSDYIYVGTLDELSINASALSSDWLITEYNNQNDQNTFYNVETGESLANWYNSSWSNRVAITVPSSSIPADLTNYPVLVDLSDLPSSFFSTVQSDGGDIVVTSSDYVTKLSRELVSINTGASTGELWFNAPLLSASTDTTFYIYYGNALANESNSTQTWNSDFVYVEHMNEDPSAAAPQFINSSQYPNSGTSYGTMLSNDLVAGKVGNAIDLDGSNDFIDVTSMGGYTAGSNLTIDLWTKPSILNGSQDILIDGNGGASPQVRLELASNQMRVNLGNGGSWCVTNVAGGGALTVGAWTRLTFTYDGSTLRLYRDGTQVNTANTTCSVAMTGLNIGRFSGGGSYYYGGAIDEVRVMRTVMDSNWMSATAANINSPDTFYSVGTQEGINVWYDASWSNRIKLTVNDTEVGSPGFVSDFPVYVDLSDLPSSFFSAVKSDGSDIVVTSANKTTKLTRELVDIDTVAETGELWFKAPFITSNADTEFYIYYNNSAASETNSTNVWSNNYRMVHHLNESNGSDPLFNDSTSNANNPNNNGLDPDDVLAAIVGNGIGPDAEWVSVPHNANLEFSTEDFSYSAWIKTTNNTFQSIIGKTHSDVNSGYSMDMNTNGTVRCIFADSTSHMATTTAALNDGNWHYVVCSRATSQLTVTWDGINSATDTDASANVDSGVTFLVGNRNGSSVPYTGFIDEIQVRSVSKAGNWIETEHNNISSPATFYTLGSVESN